MTHALKIYRLEKKLTLDAFAKQSGVSKPHLCKIENGHKPGRNAIEKLCAYTGLSPLVFFQHSPILRRSAGLKVARIAHPLKVFRKKKNLTLEQLAVAVGVSQSRLSMIENGRPAGRQAIEKLIAYTGLSADVFFTPSLGASSPPVGAGLGEVAGSSEPATSPVFSSEAVELVRAFNAWTPESGSES